MRICQTPYAQLTEPLDPIQVHDGYSLKRGDLFRLGPVNGSKVRQCLAIVNHLLERSNSGGRPVKGLVTGGGLPSPQVAIVAAVANYFGLPCAITTPRYREGLRDYRRINSSLAQRLGAVVYGVGNPRSSGYEKDAKVLAATLGYHQIKFGMFGEVALEPVIRQVQNVPEHIKRLVVIAGSGLSAISILRGLARYEKTHVENVHIITLSHHFERNRALWYYSQKKERYQGRIWVHPSPFPYGAEYKHNEQMFFDLTYEGKAWAWLTATYPANESTLFWIIGRRNYNLDLIEPIRWHMSPHEEALRTPQPEMKLVA